MRRRGLLVLLLAPAVVRPARAGAGPAAPVAALYAGLLGVMKQGRAVPFATRFAALAPVIAANFDLARILRLAVGPEWAGLPAAAKRRLAHLFRDFTVASYVANFDRYSGEKFDVLPGSRAVGAERVVKTEIVGGDGTRNRLDYVVAPHGGGWRIVDVLLEGTISQLAVQRSEYSGLVGAGDAARLIAALAAKIGQLSGGALHG